MMNRFLTGSYISPENYALRLSFQPDIDYERLGPNLPVARCW